MLAPTAAARHGTDNEHVDERQDGATKEDGPSAETHQAEQAGAVLPVRSGCDSQVSPCSQIGGGGVVVAVSVAIASTR